MDLGGGLFGDLHLGDDLLDEKVDDRGEDGGIAFKLMVFLTLIFCLFDDDFQYGLFFSCCFSSR